MCSIPFCLELQRKFKKIPIYSCTFLFQWTRMRRNFMQQYGCIFRVLVYFFFVGNFVVDIVFVQNTFCCFFFIECFFVNKWSKKANVVIILQKPDVNVYYVCNQRISKACDNNSPRIFCSLFILSLFFCVSVLLKQRCSLSNMTKYHV